MKAGYKTALDKFYEEQRVKQIAMLEEWAAKAPPAIAEIQRAEIAKLKSMTLAQYRRYGS